MNIQAKPPGMKPGVYLKLSEDAYHSGEGVSKSGLWTIETRSPAHYKFGLRKETKPFDFGHACHLAILQPNEFEQMVVRGPEDRRGNKWKDVAEICKVDKKLLLTSGDYDGVLTVRDTVHADPWVNSIITGGDGVNEASGYWIDQDTGELCRCRPDRYRRDLKLILDVKTAASAHPDAFAKSVVNYGYHAQEAFYTDGWQACGQQVDAFAFLSFEKEPPYAFAVYELPPSIVEEGRAVMRKALNTYADCRKANRWPSYGEGVQELSFKRWNYRLTQAPEALDEALPG
ncbi:PD-(D/E)XK nuclease-like domain-containing protein [Bradyrhizobium sp. HKCCYLS2038]|uniref:PD-(D/E)XK nuclease-like domain-containing protein n=1 Tax=Bradyrhizobium sp. HKCCYLS2038 TaxID=3420764 RepID=UPI003EBE4D91